MSVLRNLAHEIEAAHEAYRDALDTEAEATAEYLRAFHRAFATAVSDRVAVTARRDLSNNQAVDELVSVEFASAAVKSCRSKVDEVSARLSAAQSYVRFERENT